MKVLSTLLALLILAACAGNGGLSSADVVHASPIEIASGAVALPNRGYFSTGQPDEAMLDRIAEAGYTAVVDLRGVDEDRGIDEASAVEQRGLRYLSLPLSTPADLTSENARRLTEFLDAEDGPVLLHCQSGNRVGSIFAIAAKDEGRSTEEALALGRKAGLTRWEPNVREILEAR